MLILSSDTRLSLRGVGLSRLSRESNHTGWCPHLPLTVLRPVNQPLLKGRRGSPGLAPRATLFFSPDSVRPRRMHSEWSLLPHGLAAPLPLRASRFLPSGRQPQGQSGQADFQRLLVGLWTAPRPLQLNCRTGAFFCFSVRKGTA